MANKDKNSGSNLTRQHHQLATGKPITGMAKGGSASCGTMYKGAKVAAPKRGK